MVSDPARMVPHIALPPANGMSNTPTPPHFGAADTHDVTAAPTTILVIDDDTHVRRAVRDYLEDMGRVVREAATGLQGLEAFRESPPDAVLLDLRMPEMHGLDVLAALRELAPHTPVIVLSGAGVMEDVISALRLGAWDFVTKPVLDFAVLGDSIERALERVRRIRKEERRRAEMERRVEQGAHQLQEVLAQLEAHYDFLEDMLDSIPTPVFFKDAGGNYFGANTSFCQFVGLSQAHVMTDSPEDVLPEAVAKALADYEANPRAAVTCELRFPAQDDAGETRDLCLTFGPITLTEQNDASPGRTRHGVVGVIFDVTEQRRAERELLRQAFHDPLTGLANRELFMNRVEGAMHRMRREPRCGFAVLHLDLDRFKVIVESQGHLVGDKVLQEVAKRLEEVIRRSDMLARLGGDEFAVMVEDFPERCANDALQSPSALRVAQRIQRSLKAPILVDGEAYFITASIGVVIADPDYEYPAELLRDADIAMHRAKSSRDGACQLYDSAMHVQAREAHYLDTEMRRILQGHTHGAEGFFAHYQPIIRLEDHTVVGFEALSRWRHPKTGFIEPGKFIQIAEENGAIHELGRLVMQSALRDLRDWRRETPLDDLFMSVNISGKQAMRPRFQDEVFDLLAHMDMPPERLKLEITESVLMEDMDAVNAVLEEIHGRGVALCLDDFGTGYSSLAHLHRFPMDVIKIDRSFIWRLLPEHGVQCAKTAGLVRAILAIARSLELDVVAEGVESQAQTALLASMGCRMVQGFYYAPPVSTDEVAERLRRQGLVWTPETPSPAA